MAPACPGPQRALIGGERLRRIVGTAQFHEDVAEIVFGPGTIRQRQAGGLQDRLKNILGLAKPLSP